jgi:uncharacterized protein YndB with AHSA1/START domain
MATTTKGSAKFTLPTDDQILITREFAAPRHLVYKVWTDPTLVNRWWHAGHGEMTCCEIDLRVGGKYRFAMNAGGMEVAFHGEFKEIITNEKIVAVEVYEGAPEFPALNTTTFEESGDRTVFRLLIQCPSKMSRDAVIASGMEAGFQVGMDLAEQVAVSLL